MEDKKPFNLWIYFKDSWEGKDGKFSYRRFSQYIFLICMVKMGFKPPQNNLELNVFYVFAALYSLVATIITVQQLIELLKLYKEIKSPGIITNQDEKAQDM